ncbi:MAG: winged helix DNA-binding domain-containing protein [Actinomycetota bacterium]|nr:winged helix DNA-binding domain-containing protein [Actinomycetota bacterium]
MRSVDTAERRARLAVRHRLAPGHHADDVVDVARSLVALHATDPPTVVLSAGARTDHLTPASVESALHDDRTLIRVMAMRRTLWVIPRELLPAVLAGASDRVAGAERRRLIRDVERAGLHDDGTTWLDAACTQVLDVLGTEELTSTELRERAPLLAGTLEHGAGRSWGGTTPIAPRVLTVLSAEGRVLRATNDGGWHLSRPRYAVTEHWLGHAVPNQAVPDDAAGDAALSVEDAVDELVTAWLRSFGPGTEDDLVWWLGSTRARVRGALARVGAVSVALDGATGYLLPDDLDVVAAPEPWVALLPVLDPTTMGWKDRDWYVGEHRAQLYDSAGNGGATIWCNGAIVGGWWQLEDGTVRTELLEDIGAEATAAVDERAAALTEWFDGRRVMPRFPSPLALSHRR